MYMNKVFFFPAGISIEKALNKSYDVNTKSKH